MTTGFEILQRYFGFGIGDFRQDSQTPLKVDSANIRNGYGASRALQELHAESPLELVDSFRYDRIRYVHTSRSADEAAGPSTTDTKDFMFVRRVHRNVRSRISSLSTSRWTNHISVEPTCHSRSVCLPGYQPR